MAETLEEYPWHKPHGNRKYPWEQWTDGQIWRAKRNEDYTITSQQLMSRLRTKANLYGLKVRVRYNETECVFQFYVGED